MPTDDTPSPPPYALAMLFRCRCHVVTYADFRYAIAAMPLMPLHTLLRYYATIIII